jgi:hypothetical protein
MSAPTGTFDRVVAALRPTGDPAAGPDLFLRAGLVAFVAVLTLVLFPPRGGQEAPAVRAGVVAPDDVIAPFDYEVRWSGEELSRRQDLAALTVSPVYMPSPAVVDRALANVESYLDRVGTALEEPEVGAAELEALNRIDGQSLGLRPVELRDLAERGTRDALLAFARDVLPRVYADGWFLSAAEIGRVRGSQISVLVPEGDEVSTPIADVIALRPGAEIAALDERARLLEPPVERLARQLLPGLMVGNLEARPSLTAIRREEARRRVSPIRAEVLRGELVVGAHTRVSAEQEEKVRALAAELDRRRGGLSPENARAGIGALLLDAAILALLGFYLFLYRRDVFGDFRALAVLAALWSLVVGLAAFVDRVDSVPPHAAPVALGSLLIAVLWDTRLSAVVTLFLAGYLAGHGGLGFPLLWTGLVGGLCGAWSVRRLRRRTHFYETLVFIAAGNLFAIGCIALMRLWGWGEFGVAAGWGFLSAGVAVFLAMGLLPILEWASGRTTDLTLLELGDLNRPLLKQLLLDAPGTYHHSIIVGHLAESAAEGIGANSLVARVGSYYHDIGKVRHPQYFVENQRQGLNPHDHLEPRASARIVSRHVSDGIEMARAAGLPECVMDVIREHHGTTRLTYFWHKAGDTEERDLGDFRYPGPRPRSKETAVVMLADSVEAASRVGGEPTPEKLRATVRRIVEMKLAERQLDEADLTFRDLAVVEESFVSVLAGMHHQRVDYPAVSLHAPAVDDAESPGSSSSAGHPPEGGSLRARE